MGACKFLNEGRASDIQGMLKLWAVSCALGNEAFCREIWVFSVLVNVAYFHVQT